MLPVELLPGSARGEEAAARFGENPLQTSGSQGEAGARARSVTAGQPARTGPFGQGASRAGPETAAALALPGVGAWVLGPRERSPQRRAMLTRDK